MCVVFTYLSSVFSEDTSWAKDTDGTLQQTDSDGQMTLNIWGPNRISAKIMVKPNQRYNQQPGLKALILLKKLDPAALTVSHWLCLINVQLSLLSFLQCSKEIGQQILS